jgi:hypothetical protein
VVVVLLLADSDSIRALAIKAVPQDCPYIPRIAELLSWLSKVKSKLGADRRTSLT